MNIVVYLLILLNAGMLVGGQLLWKAGLRNAGDGFQNLKSIIGLLFSPYILGGGFLYVLATVLWLYILSKAELSVAYPMQSVAYIIAAVASFYLFGESLSLAKIFGCVLILAGVAVIGWSSKPL